MEPHYVVWLRMVRSICLSVCLSVYKCVCVYIHTHTYMTHTSTQSNTFTVPALIPTEAVLLVYAQVSFDSHADGI